MWHCHVSYSVGLRCNLDLMLLWLWCRPAAAAPIQPLSRELPYAAYAALKKKKIKTNKQKTQVKLRSRGVYSSDIYEMREEKKKEKISSSDH